MKRYQIPSAWNDTAVDYPQDKVICQLFEAQVEQTPDATAYIFESETLTYRELNERSNRLAHYLRRAGVGPKVWVGLCLDRSPAMVVGILAVLKAGGVYVPLEPTAPRLRLWQILQDTQPAFLLLQSSLNHFDEYTGQKIFLGCIEKELAEEATTNLVCLTTPDDLLKVVYTSASTGKPKGALIPISAVLNRLYWMWNDYPFRNDDMVVFHKSYALVAATWECFGGLLKGIPTLVLTRQDVLDPAVMLKKLAEHRVSYLHATPSLLQCILDQADQEPDQWRSLRLTTISAEPITVGLARRWCKMFSGIPLLNLYGSTECSSNVTVYDTQNLPLNAKCVPIGKPFANNHVYILDDELQPVSSGETGEMCVSGACLSRGYHNLPELTREKFIKHPFMSNGELEKLDDRDVSFRSRLFKTGDLAYCQPDGTIELVGRKDNQVKIRGFRVELEGVEATLLENDVVKKCAVSLRHDPVLGDCLAAYVVLNSETTALALRRFLQERLPEYMIPAYFTHLEALPLTAAGKIDRQNLPLPDVSWSKKATDCTAPRNELEHKIHQVMQDVLQTSEIGIEDYFLDLGLHSLLMVQVQGQLSHLLQRDIPITAILQYATVRSLAQHLSKAPKMDNEPLKKGRYRAEKRRTMRRQRQMHI